MRLHTCDHHLTFSQIAGNQFRRTLVAYADGDLHGRQQASVGLVLNPNVPLLTDAILLGRIVVGRVRRCLGDVPSTIARSQGRTWLGFGLNRRAALGTFNTSLCFSIWKDKLAVMPGMSFNS